MSKRARERLDQLIRCELKTLELCRRSGLVDGYRWQAKSRQPPLPFHEGKAEPGRCRVCGQPTKGRLTWHEGCTTTYFLWTKPSDYVECLVLWQDGLCDITKAPIGPPAAPYITSVDIDHEIPIFRVRRQMADLPWFDLLRFWGLSNLRAIAREAHKAKSALEAKERSKVNTALTSGRI